MLRERRVDFIAGRRYWAVLPSLSVSPATRTEAEPAARVIQHLETWITDPIVWPNVLDLYELTSGIRASVLTTADVDVDIKPALRAAFQSGALLAFAADAEQHPPLAAAGVTIVTPTPTTALVLDDTPRMPTIEVVARVTGLIPDPTSTTSFDWTAELRHRPRADGDRHGPNRDFVLNASGRSMGGRFTIAFDGLIAGALTITVQALVDRRPVVAQKTGLTVVATNPRRAVVQTALGDDLLQRIACHESGQRQFDTAPGNTTVSPLWSGDNQGGVGLFQITVPEPTIDQVWNWRANAAAGRARLDQGRRAAQNYPVQIRSTHTLAAMLARINERRSAAGLPALPSITVPDLSGDQVEDDAIRAFNGYGGNRDVFGLPLHEFRLVMDGAEVRLAINEAARTATASWERVPVAARGRSGDPDYVNHVRSASPSCGG